MNLPCYGRVFRIYDCDRWTRVGTIAGCLSIILKVLFIVIMLVVYGIQLLMPIMTCWKLCCSSETLYELVIQRVFT